MRLFKREPEPLLSDGEMARLHEEIFEEPVSAERLFTMYDALPPSARDRSEWVMDERMRNRIRSLLAPQASGAFYVNWSGPEMLIGLPIVVEPLARLALRERKVRGHE